MQASVIRPEKYTSEISIDTDPNHQPIAPTINPLQIEDKKKKGKQTKKKKKISKKKKDTMKKYEQAETPITAESTNNQTASITTNYNIYKQFVAEVPVDSSHPNDPPQRKLSKLKRRGQKKSNPIVIKPIAFNFRF